MAFLTDKAAKAQIATLESRIEELETDATARDERITHLESEIVTKDADIVEKTSKITTLETENQSHTATITGLQDELTQAKADITAAQESAGAEAIEILASIGQPEALPEAHTGLDEPSDILAKYESLKGAEKWSFLAANSLELASAARKKITN